MTKLLVAKVIIDGAEHTIKTYANENENPKIVLKDILPHDAEIISVEWHDTLSENREEWNKANPECPIPMDA